MKEKFSKEVVLNYICDHPHGYLSVKHIAGDLGWNTGTTHSKLKVLAQEGLIAEYETPLKLHIGGKTIETKKYFYASWECVPVPSSLKLNNQKASQDDLDSILIDQLDKGYDELGEVYGKPTLKSMKSMVESMLGEELDLSWEDPVAKKVPGFYEGDIVKKSKQLKKKGPKPKVTAEKVIEYLKTGSWFTILEISYHFGMEGNTSAWWIINKELIPKGCVKVGKLGKQKVFKYVESKHVVTFTIEDKKKEHIPFTGAGNKAAVWELWELVNLNLKTECADFYALYELSLDHEDVKVEFERKRESLAKQFANYLDMACGGELRHAYKRVDLVGLVTKYPVVKHIDGDYSSSRSGAWMKWKQIREEMGLEALEGCEHIFSKCGWHSSGFGGKKWGKVAQTLISYLKEEDSQTIFVDTVWALEHNGGCVLNKRWDTHGLKPILDAKFSGYMKGVIPYCSQKVRGIWNGKNGDK